MLLIVALAAKYRFAHGLSLYTYFAVSGGVISYGIDYGANLLRQAALLRRPHP